MRWLRYHIKNNDDSSPKRDLFSSPSSIPPENIDIDFHFTDSHKYLTDFISGDINKWQPNEPIIISAQTGSGKNHFIQETLLPKLIDENPNTKDLMLILSNRIALTRQTKMQFADSLVKYAHNAKYSNEIEKYYTSEGLDKLYIDFGVVTICSYHQMIERHILDDNKFKYIICDECHFFTSDSLFNSETNKMLEEIVNKGQNSIRIYMSATPDVVFEPIIRTEYGFRETLIENDIKILTNLKEDKNFKLIPFLKNPPIYQFTSEFGKYRFIQNIHDVDNCIEEERNDFNLKLKFYYMARNYNYIENIFSYPTEDVLANIVEKSSSKWLIFSNRSANEIMSAIKSKSIDCILLSRDKINSNLKVNDEYRYIIDHETTSKKVVISTSVLDNGINIKNDKLKENEKILNIAIDVTDRTEFIQMLGRIRFNDTDKINLYIKENSIDELKKILLDQTKSLIIRLANDYSSVKDKQDSFIKYSNFFYFTSDETFSTYNDCAIYQLISQISEILTFIKEVEPDFYIEFESPEMEALKGSVYDFYKDHGRYKSWSRSIIDILESKKGNKFREEYRIYELKHGWHEHYHWYDYNLQDTFTNYIFSELIPRCYINIMQSYLDSYIERLNDDEKNIYQGLIKQEFKQDISVFDKIKFLKNLFKDHFIDISIDYTKDFYNKINHYKNLSIHDDSEDFLQVKLKWIEKDYNLTSDIDSNESLNDNYSIQPDYEKYKRQIIEKIISEEEFKENKIGQEYARGIIKFPEVFLKVKGIKNDNDEAEWISKNCCKNIGRKQLKTQSFELEGHYITIRSVQSKSNETYYLLVEKEGSEHVC